MSESVYRIANNMQCKGKDMMTSNPTTSDKRTVVRFKGDMNDQKDTAHSATELAKQDIAMLHQFLEMTQAREPFRHDAHTNMEGDFLTEILSDYRMFQKSTDVARQKKVGALEMLATNIENAIRAQEVMTEELKHSLAIQRQHILEMLQELRK